ncbi:hypothetical protein [Streptomyces caniscabiei]|uniref:Uncharacterized protein n=1 Tax=Streptomyces caniscabiei TaxID=2746961 RepID=A0A927L2C1_9ACTN|nr:hypothetical protein [Streptomyces caniscabiei]MBD9724157.1 hypothetical protein [Streptomyces caniscabiei]MDX3513141.1 hypothetical protein [Streptomyces caniscabiei]MDX3718642.1 hypothetical protein [Streptomyces caniscabiei]WEO21960.1 hypothetical protein IHE65_01755 [Streptomyces caniscabiei]
MGVLEEMLRGRTAVAPSSVRCRQQPQAAVCGAVAAPASEGSSRPCVASLIPTSAPGRRAPSAGVVGEGHPQGAEDVLGSLWVAEDVLAGADDHGQARQVPWALVAGDRVAGPHLAVQMVGHPVPGRPPAEDPAPPGLVDGLVGQVGVGDDDLLRVRDRDGVA